MNTTRSQAEPTESSNTPSACIQCCSLVASWFRSTPATLPALWPLPHARLQIPRDCQRLGLRSLIVAACMVARYYPKTKSITRTLPFIPNNFQRSLFPQPPSTDPRVSHQAAFFCFALLPPASQPEVRRQRAQRENEAGRSRSLDPRAVKYDFRRELRPRLAREQVRRVPCSTCGVAFCSEPGSAPLLLGTVPGCNGCHCWLEGALTCAMLYDVISFSC